MTKRQVLWRSSHYRQIGIGAGVGIVLAMVGGFALRQSQVHGWISGAWVQVPIVALAMFCFGLAQWLGGSGFIACFVGGLVFGGLVKQHKEEVLNGAEGAGNVFSLLTWFTFGAVVVGKGFQHVSWEVIAYALLSLTVIRILPVVLCLIGVPAKLDTKLFIGWFGPRGLGEHRLYRDGPSGETAGQRNDGRRCGLDRRTEHHRPRHFGGSACENVWTARRFTGWRGLDPKKPGAH